MKGLNEIKNEKELLSKINWEMKPRPRMQRTANETEEEMAELSKQLQKRVGFYFFIEVIFGQPAVFLYENYPDGSGRYLAEITDVPGDMLRDAIEDAGGSLEQNGRYPLNESVRTWLRKELGC